MKQNKGFTLIETAIVIIILSFILVPLYGLILQQREQDQIRQENAIDQSVLAALSLFLKENGRYPCPADPAFAFGDAAFGDENLIAAGSCSSGTDGVTVVSGVAIGDLPFVDLGISPKLAANTKNWRYIYAVTETSTIAGFDPALAAVQIDTDNDGAADDVTAHFIIVNPGPDGRGAVRLTGEDGIACGNTTADSENCDDDEDFLDTLESIPGDFGAAHYDDVVSYSLARQETTFWMPIQNANGSLDIVNRNAGAIGIGTADPDDTSKLHVSGGNIVVDDGGTGTGGNVRADQNVTATDDIRATDRVVVESGRAISPVFSYCSTTATPPDPTSCDCDFDLAPGDPDYCP